MGPRKKAKPNPKADVQPSPNARQPSAAAIPLPTDREPESGLKEATGCPDGQNGCPVISTPPNGSKGTGAKPIVADSGSDIVKTTVEKDTTRARKSWYGGTWPRIQKVAPITQIAKESISAATEVASETVASARKLTSRETVTPVRSPSLHLSQSMSNPTRSLPLSATITKVNASSSLLGRSPNESNTKSQDSHKAAPSLLDGKRRNSQIKVSDDSIKSSDRVVHEVKDATPGILTADTQSVSYAPSLEIASSWLGWFSRGENTHNQPPNSLDVVGGPSDSYEATEAEPIKPNPKDRELIRNTRQSLRRKSDPNPVAAGAQPNQQRRSWIGSFWGIPASSTEAGKVEDRCESISNTFSRSSAGSDLHSAYSSNNLKTLTKSPGGKIPEEANTALSSGWAFWSRSAQQTSNKANTFEPIVGELAVAGSPSQSKPEDATVDRVKGLPKAADKTGKSIRPSSRDAQDLSKESDSITARSNNGVAVAASIPASSKLPRAASSQTSHATRSNLLLPAFRQTYHVHESPGFFQQLGHYLNYGKLPLPKHVSLVRNPPRIKTALAIGVHGYFPAPLIRSVLGQPTGTSIKFAESAANAIQQWTQERGYSCSIEKIALEGEGKIEERVKLLWTLILNWLEDIRKADLILVACHSQGVPVAMMLISKLIALGCVNGARIGVCAMAGVNMGPFASYQSRWISGSAGELFDFARPDSKVSKDYEAALSTALSFGVRVVYVGSIDDQLVSLEACCSNSTMP
ncbi:MAG: hypothetical protein Q9187_000077 [Circinaria calcarea]